LDGQNAYVSHLVQMSGQQNPRLTQKGSQTDLLNQLIASGSENRSNLAPSNNASSLTISETCQITDSALDLLVLHVVCAAEFANNMVVGISDAEDGLTIAQIESCGRLRHNLIYSVKLT